MDDQRRYVQTEPGGLAIPERVAARQMQEQSEDPSTADPLEQLRAIQLCVSLYTSRPLNPEERLIVRHLTKALKAADKQAKRYVQYHTKHMEEA